MRAQKLSSLLPSPFLPLPPSHLPSFINSKELMKYTLTQGSFQLNDRFVFQTHLN